MTDHIQGGAFAVARKIFNSGIWLKHPLYLKTWIWILGRATYEDHERKGFQYKRGEFVTTYDEIIKAATYHHNRKHIFPTIKQIRIMLNWFADEGMIIVQPLREIDASPLNPEHGLIGADPRARTRAYIGIKIIVVNYDTYQDLENYKGRHKGRPTSLKGHNNNKGTIKVTNPEAISNEISLLIKRYSNQEIINQTFQAISSTRKSNRIKNTVKLSILQTWEKYPSSQVEAALKIYVEKNYSDQGKDEKYLLGIIRKQKPAPDQGAISGPRYKEITPENLGALYEN